MRCVKFKNLTHRIFFDFLEYSPQKNVSLCVKNNFLT